MQSNSLNRRAFFALLGGSALAWLGRRRIHDTAQLAAAHLASALDLDALRPLAARVGTPSIGLDELILRTCELAPARVLELTPAALRSRFHERTLADYAAGRITRVGGWWLAHAEADALALAVRVALPWQVT